MNPPNPDNWTLTIEFDDLATQERVSPDLVFPHDECSRLVAYVAKIWGLLPEELPELAEWTSTKITFQLEILDFAGTIMHWATTHAVPKNITLIRNDER